MSFGGIFHDFLEGSWDEAKGYLREELQQLRTALNNQSSVAAFDPDEGTLEAISIQGDAKPATRYVSNTGSRNAPRWDRVNLANGVKSILAFSFLPKSPISTLLGRRGSGSTGDIEVITLGPSLEMTGTELDLSPGAFSVFMDSFSVFVDPAGALDGKGIPSDPLAVKTDGTTIQINGSNELEVIGGSFSVFTDATGALDGDGTVGNPLAVRTDGTTIQINGSNELEVIGGAGDSTYTAAQASRPASSNDGDLFLPNNGFTLQRDTGTVWNPWGPIFPFTSPVDADFSWVNQGGASVVTTNGGISLIAPIDATATNVRGRFKTAPATPWTVTALILVTTLSALTFAGLGVRESGSSKLQILFCRNGAVGIVNYTNSTTFSTLPVSDVGLAQVGVNWFRITDDNTNRIYSISSDGINFLTLFTTPRTTFLTADQVGLTAFGNATYPSVGTLLSWKET